LRSPRRSFCRPVPLKKLSQGSRHCLHVFLSANSHVRPGTRKPSHPATYACYAYIHVIGLLFRSRPLWGLLHTNPARPRANVLCCRGVSDLCKNGLSSSRRRAVAVVSRWCQYPHRVTATRPSNNSLPMDTMLLSSSLSLLGRCLCGHPAAVRPFSSPRHTLLSVFICAWS
jgi:hypothetical protein